MVLIRKKMRSRRRRPFRKLTLKKLARAVRVRKPELKYSIDYQAAAAITTAGTIYNLSQIAQGDTAVARDGLWVRPTRLNLRCVTYDTSTGLQYCRFVLFQWRDNTVNPPTVAKIFLNNTGGATPSHIAPINPIFKDKIRVLSDKLVAYPQYVVSAGANTTSKGVQWVYSVRVPKPIKYQDDVATNYETGNLFLVALPTSATANLSYDGLLRFHE